MAISRDDVVDAAVRLLGEVGLEGLTLRRLASDLGVSAPTLYWHVADKRTLLDHVAERLLADQWRSTPPAPGQPWWEWLRERALTQYRALVAHRDAALVVAGNRPTDEALPSVESTLAVLADAGLAPAEAFATLMAIGNLVIGSAVEHHAEQARPSGSSPAPDPVRRPHAATAVASLTADPDHEDLVGYALDLMLDGLRARLAARSADGPAGSPSDGPAGDQAGDRAPSGGSPTAVAAASAT